LVRIWQEAVVTYFKDQSQHLREGLEKPRKISS